VKQELLKTIVQAVVIERNDEGLITGEKLSDPVAVYSNEQYNEYVASIKASLQPTNGASAGD
jgi:hypothetical protein